eukprot:CAMPEP_0195643684 /NCGR_PEP_ID=MMETSP0815-20121206/27968_1 /TAXON_ID=97485 /ORGANISM="Prymnesium parvum, Strain Texoma1" /LENGTH=62 /DNA_ID=CAMNT_0040786745 /DNA_START=59 /DNA_END=244 /DNA_ORIENTATION=-
MVSIVSEHILYLFELGREGGDQIDLLVLQIGLHEVALKHLRKRVDHLERGHESAATLKAFGN